ncbi:MarR family winged helix-turn-helix transcriptional regulator [Mucilaginibacter sp. UC70_90]
MENIHLLSQNLRLINYFYTRSLAKELSAMKVGYHFEVLLILARQEQPLTQNQLAELLHIDKSRVANIVSSLQEKKLVTVKTNPADRRQHHIFIIPGFISIHSTYRTEDSANK